MQPGSRRQQQLTSPRWPSCDVSACYTSTFERPNKQPEPAALAEGLYLGLLTRRPTAAEIADVSAYLQARADQRPAALQELAWVLLTSAEFRFSR